MTAATKRMAERELKLTTELQNNHGWAFFEMPKSQRHTMAFERRVVKGKATSALATVRRIGVALPAMSALAQAFDAFDARTKSKVGLSAPIASAKRKRGGR